ncbi:unnamed protein product [Phytomonas sp. Hart1]|nr:unnamed protein product [Phytomonas sp. Hart1]|eukprot:CCW72332.1 unnamed protein product [Phytomonas sp. isolate Hart1]
MSVRVETGAMAAPGEVLFASPVGAREATAGAGCYTRVVEGAGEGAERHIVASRLGVVQWDGSVVAVYPWAALSPRVGGGGSVGEAVDGLPASGARAAVVFGPRPGHHVLVRITHSGRFSASGEVIAVDGVWSSGGGGAVPGRQDSFRGVLRAEDIRPFRVTKDQLQPPLPSEAFCAGDVVQAQVLSQSEARLYQLTTIPECCGVVQSSVQCGGQQVELQAVPGRRDGMLCPVDRQLYPRWCPLVPAPERS